MLRNTASQKIALFAFTIATNAAKTGDAANLTAYVSKDGGAVTVLGDTSATEMEATNAPGWYLFDLTQGETDFVDGLFTAKSATGGVSVVGRPVTTILDAAGIRTAVGLASANLDTQLVAIDDLIDTEVGAIKTKTDFLPSATAGSAGGVFIAGSNAATSITTALTANIIGNVTGNLSGSVGSVTGAVGSVTGLTASDVGAIKTKTDFLPSATAGAAGGLMIAGANAATTVNITGNITGNLSGSVGSVTGAVGSVTGNVGGNVVGTVASVVGAVGSVTGLTASNLDVAVSTLATAANLATVDGIVDAILVDTAEIGAAGAGLTALASAANLATVDTVVDSILVDTAEIGAAGAGLTALASAANLATLSAFVDTEVAAILAAVDTEVAAILADTNELQTDWANGGRLDLILDARASQTSVDDLPTNAELATALGTADDAVLAQVAVANAVLIKLDDTLEDAGTDGFIFSAIALSQAPTGGTAPTVGQIADEVQTRTIAAVTVVNGLAANVITAAATAADFTTEIQAGLASQTSVDDLPTNAELATALAAADDAVLAQVALVKAKTDNLPADPADASDIAAATTAIAGYIDTEVGAIKAVTDKLDDTLEDAGTDGFIFSAVALSQAPTGGTAPTVTEIADEVQTRTIAAVTLVNGLAANVITAAATAADFTTEIQAGLATAAALDAVDNFIDTEVGAIKAKTDLIPAAPAAVGDIPTAAAIADQVWDEAIAGHVGAGSTGEALTAAGLAGDPWIAALPGAYGAGTAGKIVGDNLNATVSSRASQTSVDDVPTNAELATALGTADDAVLAQVALVKAKTDLIPAAPAAVGDVPTAIENADALLNRDMATGVDSGSPTVRTPRQALRILRNKWSFTGSTQTITKEDDATASWTQIVTATAGADPITGTDPAGP